LNLQEFWEEYNTYIIMLIVALYWIILREKGPQSTNYTWDLIIVFIILAILVFRGLIWRAKCNSPKLVGLEYDTSLGIQPYPVTDKGITYWNFRAEGFRDGIFFSKGQKGLVVVPEVYVKRLGNNFVVLGFFEPVYIHQLPRNIQLKIMEEKIRPPYYMCDNSISLITTSLELKESELIKYASTFYAAYRAQESVNTELVNTLNKDQKSTEIQTRTWANFAKSFEKEKPPSMPSNPRDPTKG
jgi:hypothetical protein